MIRKVIQLLVLAIVLIASVARAKGYVVKSPGGQVQVIVTVGSDVKWVVSFNGIEILSPSAVSMTILDGPVLGLDPQVIGESETKTSQQLFPVVPVKNRIISDHYRQLTLKFKGDYALQFRAYDDAAAYRFVTSLREQIKIKAEQIQFNFAGDYNVWFPREDSFFSHQERAYEYRMASDIPDEHFCSTPSLVDLGNGRKMLITESDLIDYPGLWLKGTGKNSFNAIFPHYPRKQKKESDRDIKPDDIADYIAVTEGTRSFPWRLLVLAKDDLALLNNETVFKLASPCQLKDTSWIKPGRVAWDWWNAWNVFGEDVSFKAGINTETYKYYIDFAAKYGIEYVILDEGWSSTEDLLRVRDGLDMDQLSVYAKEKNVGLILWMLWYPLDNQLEPALKKFKEWGVKGLKVDFMQRDDQLMVDYYHRIAKAAAGYEMLVDYHGAYKPAGLRRMYPNVITREGVIGQEWTKWSGQAHPKHNVTLPFIRMVAGPMDYTPGAMDNAQKDKFKPVNGNPMSLGTRCHQLAMYVIFESPLQMLCDTPSKYYRDPQCTEFIAKIPTVWDQTVMMGRKSGDEYYIGAMTDWNPRELDLDLSFLPSGKWTMEIFQDGPGAFEDGTDYRKLIKVVTNADKMKLKLTTGGGWAARVFQTK
jgi:alpha-glucosidase